MGDFARDYIDSCLHQFIDEGSFSHTTFVLSSDKERDKYSLFEYKQILTQTTKAWYLLMSGGAKRWYPKFVCELNEEEKTVKVPEWLVDKWLIEAGKQLGLL